MFSVVFEVLFFLLLLDTCQTKVSNLTLLLFMVVVVFVVVVSEIIMSINYRNVNL